MRKYIEIFKYSMKTKITFIYNYLFSLFSFGIHVFVFNELWDYILNGKTILGYTKSELIWYIIIAELVTYSSESTYKKIGSMVKQGDIANMLIKPVDIINYFIAESSSLIIKTIINIIFGIILGVTLAGSININFATVSFTLIAILIGVLIGILLQIFVGIIAFFTEENKSFWLIIQKLSFFVVFTPPEFYPTIIQKILYCLPTTYLVYTPAKIFVNFEPILAVKLLICEILSAVFLYVVIRIMYKKGVEKINVNGG